MNKKSYIVLFFLLNLSVHAQLKVGDQAPNFLLTMQNGMQGFTMPYMNRIVLVHFWSTSVLKSKQHNRALDRMTARYKNAVYKKAEGFVAVSVAVQSDKNAWLENIKQDSIQHMVNGIATRAYNDDICKKFGVNSLPADFLIDENGIIIAINPKYALVEELLDERKNYQPVQKDLSGSLAVSSNSSEMYKLARITLFNAYNDSISSTITDNNGKFEFNDIKLGQDLVFKVFNQANILTSEPLALFNNKGDRIMESVTKDEAFVFYIPANAGHKLIASSPAAENNSKVSMLNVTKHIMFKSVGNDLAITNEAEIKNIVDMMKRDQELEVEFTCHASTKLDAKTADELTEKQVQCIKKYFIAKGIPAGRIKGISKGNKEPVNKCKAGSADCSEAQHQLNQRAVFVIRKN